MIEGPEKDRTLPELGALGCNLSEGHREGTYGLSPPTGKTLSQKPSRLDSEGRRAEQPEQAPKSAILTSSSEVLTQLAASLTEVEIEPAQDAVVCGAVGCREGEQLHEVRKPAEVRVLCPHHVREWVAP